ncbi:MAG: acyl-CoA dehydratase activase [Verrucomicrobiales bacterium]|nr:acyl-CoA dehydratase activase [Verrucomicrobiota bacterium JB025]
MRIIGLDIGSRTVKRVIVEDGRMVGHRVLPGTHDPLSVCEEMLAGQEYDRVVATGYGRRLFAEHREAGMITEIRAAALGVRHVHPTARCILDIGGQDTKVISIRPDGQVGKFEMNDRCAAGTGRFLEVMATALSYSMAEFVRAGDEAEEAQAINAMCTVFAESEVISATARGVDRASMARGLHEAVSRRALAMLRRVELHDDVVFCGGGALNGCLQRFVAEGLGRDVHVPDEPQILAALGAALSALPEPG